MPWRESGSASTNDAAVASQRKDPPVSDVTIVSRAVVGTDVATVARVAEKGSGERINVAGRVNVARSVNVGSSGSIRSASTKQKVRIVQRDGETVVNEISEEKEASS